MLKISWGLLLALVNKCYAKFIYMRAMLMHICFKFFYLNEPIIIFSLWLLHNLLVFSPYDCIIGLLQSFVISVIDSSIYIYISLLLFLTLFFIFHFLQQFLLIYPSSILFLGIFEIDQCVSHLKHLMEKFLVQYCALGFFF